MFCLTVNDNLELCLLEDKHAQQLFELVDKNRDHLRRWLPWVDSTTSIKHSQAFVESALQQYTSNEGFQTAILHHNNLIGMVGYHTIDWTNRNVEIGYWIAADFQGRGLMTQACRFLVNYAFTTLKLNRVVIRCAVGNSKSAAIPKRLGFTWEGILRQQQQLNGRYVDLVVYSMLAQEWMQ
ncbi:MAG: GNAT family N-acetyltransferase [Anaerolineae bacterium]|nr:GNAT family N-acetyltransferase [Anaerolineae bacterium]